MSTNKSYNREFIKELAKKANELGKYNIDKYIEDCYCDETYHFLNDLITGNINTYTKEDWDKIKKQAQEHAGLRNMLFSRKVPKEIFSLFENTMYVRNVLLREDLQQNEIRHHLKKMSPKEIKDFITEERSRIPQKLQEYLINLPNEELKKLDYVPLSFIHQSLSCCKNIEENFEKLYEYDENAMVEIINNKYINDEARMRAFLCGCDITKITTPSDDIANKMYEAAIETLTEYKAVSSNESKIEAETILCNLIQNNDLKYSCEMDLAHRIISYEIEEPYISKIAKDLAQNSGHDLVLSALCRSGNVNLMNLCMLNKDASTRTYEDIKRYIHKKDKTKQKKLWLEFLTHKRILDAKYLVEGFEMQDHELCKLLSALHSEKFFPLLDDKCKQPEYMFYAYFNSAVDTTYFGNSYCQSLIRTMIEANFLATDNSKKLDKNSVPFLSNDEIKSIIEHIPPLICISEEDEKNIKKICSDLKERYRGTLYIKQIKNFENEVRKIIKEEEFRRQNINYFYQNNYKIYEQEDRYKFNISNLLKANNEQINQFVKNINKIGNSDLVKLLKENFIEQVAQSTTTDDAVSWILIARKFTPIYEALDEREKKLESSWERMMSGFERAIKNFDR